MRGKTIRRLLGLAVLAIAAVATTASPAAAHGGHVKAVPGAKNKAPMSTYCGIKSPAAFDSLRMLTSSTSAARGVEREPSSTEAAQEVPAGAVKRRSDFRVTVPVAFHVVHDGAEGNLTQQQIDDQINVLNATFGGFEGGAYTGFRFRLAKVTRTNNAAWFRHGFGDKDERDMKRALHSGGRETLNYYSTQASYYLGWAYFPNLSDARLYLDGVVVDWESVPGASTRYAGTYDLGKTASHEVGHWLNLYHVFQGGCNNWGDYVGDTPPQWTATRGCPVGQDSCSEPGLDSIHNYMDYSYDACYNQFTAGQAARMQEAWLYFRAP